MRILKAYKDKHRMENVAYSANSPLVKELRKHYEVDEVVLEPDYKEEDYANLIRQYDVLLTMWFSPHVPNELAENPGNLKYICHITGGMGGTIDPPIIKSPKIQVTNWGDAAGYSVAEGAVSLLMTMLKEIPLVITHAQENKDYPTAEEHRCTSLRNKRVGIYGMGYIGREFVRYLRPFMPKIYSYDPYVANMPEGVEKVNTMEELFSKSQILVVHAGLCEETRHTVTKELLALMPDGGIVINTARGAIMCEDALFEEVRSGRLRAGLDVLDTAAHPESHDLPTLDDPIRHCSNAVFTAHHASGENWSNDPTKLDFVALNCIKNLKHFENGEPLEFVIDIDRYNRMT